MMNKKFTRILALCLAAVCLFGTVAALSFDKNGDGKTNVWDLQLLADSDDEAAALEEALGGKDELRPNANGVYEIYSAVGLYNMAEHAKEDATFKLMNDIDLKGANWVPVDDFKGTFDGNGKTISNMTIATFIRVSDGANMGMFASTRNVDNDTDRTVIKDLNLADLTMVLDAGTEETNYFVGGIVGTNRGDVNNCTVTCAIYDSRTMLAKENYIGALVGRNANRTVNQVSVACGKITGSNSMDALEYYDYEPVQNGTKQTDPYEGAMKVNSQMAMFFAELESGSKARKTGIAGFGGSGSVPTDLLIQDTTNSSKYDDPELLERRTTVAAVMYEMSTVEWTPTKTLRYIRRTDTKATTAYKPTTTYNKGDVFRGIPYNHGSSGIDRFLAYMDVNSDGRYTTVSSLPEVAIYFSTAGKNALNEAYETYHAEGTSSLQKTLLELEYPELKFMTEPMSSGNQLGFNMYIGADCSSQATWAWRAVSATNGTGFAKPNNTANMYISQQWITKSGILPVNGFILEDPADLDGDGTENGSGDKSIAVKEFTRANKDFYMETLAHVTKGDLLMDYTGEGGHTLLAMSDAVTIRNYKGVLQTDLSYIITAEQGGSGGTRKGTTTDGKEWSSSCCADEVNSFDKLFADTSESETPTIFFPITCAALQQVDTPAATATCKLSGGKVTSNFHIVSTTVGKETVYTGIANGGHREACNSLTVATVHPNVQAGDTVSVLLSNGETFTFTY